VSQTPRIQVVAAVIFDEAGRLLITRRPASSHLGGYWEFPGGKIDPGEQPEEALRREIREELDARVRVEERLWQTVHSYPEKTVDISFYRCQLAGQRSPRPVQVAAMRWVFPGQLDQFSFPPADAAFITFLQKNLLP
jgi:8-oxo-dGTP diphosphatase